MLEKGWFLFFSQAVAENGLVGWGASRCQCLFSLHLQRLTELCRCSWLWSSELAEGLLSASPGEDETLLGMQR